MQAQYKISAFIFLLFLSLFVRASDGSPIGRWGYFLQDEYDDSIWALDMEITKSTTQIAVHCERNGSVDDAKLMVATRIEGDQLIFEHDAKAKGKIGCNYDVYAGPTRFEVRSTSLIFYDPDNNPIIVFYRKP